VAGTGKSSLVRHFSPAVEAAVEEHADPEILVRYVKQNMNKPMEVLRLELDLRPNNNDLSVMSIIQGRRMTLSQTKPGLVVVGLEEIASWSYQGGRDPNQQDTAQLISQRFGGRTGRYRPGEAQAPRNAATRGISGDASIIALFTSNYALKHSSRDALAKLEMFQNLICVKFTAVSGKERERFANKYICQHVADRFNKVNSAACQIDMDIPVGVGDTRSLVRHLRMLAFYLCEVQKESEPNQRGAIVASIKQNGKRCRIASGSSSIDLNVGIMENLYPVMPRVFDSRTSLALECLKDLPVDCSELSIIIDFWLARTLAPAVVVSNNSDIIIKIVSAVGLLDGVHSIQGVDAAAYKMMKSLYDPNDTPNLRDDILKYGHGAFVAVELRCSNDDAQMCCREILEDQPSMTAFSTESSSLKKAGLFFGVSVDGDITPELFSRSSLII